jgi:ankyrin repeat protein
MIDHQHFSTVRLLIERVATFKHNADNDWTPLHFAVDQAFLRGSEKLIKKSGDVNDERVKK